MEILIKSHRFLPVFRKSVQQVVRLERGREIVDLDDVAKLVRVDVDAHVNKVVVARVLNANSRGLLQVRLNLRKTGRTVNNLREEATICLSKTTTGLPPRLHPRRTHSGEIPCPSHHCPKSDEPGTREAIPRLQNQPRLVQRLGCRSGTCGRTLLHPGDVPVWLWVATLSFP